jgi:tripartite-type tricarboxylate transporter receptor subunit TctC
MTSILLTTAFRISAALTLAVLVCFSARAQDYPGGVIRIISPHPAGVATDILGRVIAAKMSEGLGQPVILENRPGANGMVAARMVSKAPPDGYILHITTGAHIANAHVAKDLGYDVLADFEPVTQLAASYGLALITNLPVDSVAELIKLAKAKPGQLSYATNGVGNITHVAGLLFDARTGTKTLPVAYNTPNLTTDVMSGTVSMTFFSIAAATPLVSSGKIKALAVTGTRRSPNLPDTPTLQELGVRDYEVTGYFGFLFPAKTPRDRIEKIYRESLKALATAEVKRLMERGGMYPVGSMPAEFGEFLKKDFDYQGKLMEEIGLKVK